jgi:hypothetical protein
MTKAALIALAVVLGSVYVYRTHAEIVRLRRSDALHRQNQAALTDSLRTVTNERGEIESSRLLLVQEKDQLAQSNVRLAQKLTRIQGDLDAALSANAEFESRDTTKTDVTVVNSDSTGIHQIKSVYDPVLPPGNRLLVESVTSFRLREGENSSLEVYDAETAVTHTLVQLSITMAIRKREDGLREAVATSSWPGLLVSVEGAILRPEMVIQKPRRSWTLPFGIGFAVGVITWEAVR